MILLPWNKQLARLIFYRNLRDMCKPSKKRLLLNIIHYILPRKKTIRKKPGKMNAFGFPQAGNFRNKYPFGKNKAITA